MQAARLTLKTRHRAKIRPRFLPSWLGSAEDSAVLVNLRWPSPCFGPRAAPFHRRQVQDTTSVAVLSRLLTLESSSVSAGSASLLVRTNEAATLERFERNPDSRPSLLFQRLSNGVDITATQLANAYGTLGASSSVFFSVPATPRGTSKTHKAAQPRQESTHYAST
ncbi:hypothetical protein BD289DRAFT_275988 [Coniella lustricola]|uniref:Uncharacterized protein n=1 Tax=Coniella lustricola TaxID=2025994 RepID=A0A2T3A6P5_9PEZI|nr:hypothetical protein BD289DRAFT_275988 [Coniella lustricola]